VVSSLRCPSGWGQLPEQGAYEPPLHHPVQKTRVKRSMADIDQPGSKADLASIIK